MSRLARQAGVVRPPAYGDFLRSRPKSRTQAASKTQCFEYDLGANGSYQSVGPISHNIVFGPVMLVSSYKRGDKAGICVMVQSRTIGYTKCGLWVDITSNSTALAYLGNIDQ